MKTIAQIVAIGLVIGFLGGCNTVHGFGQDVSATGHEIQIKAVNT